MKDADEIDPVVYGWCRDHGWCVFDAYAEDEFGIWCAEIDAYHEIDEVDGEYRMVYGYDIAESRYLRDLETENEAMREELYDQYCDFLAAQ